jgi:two-component system, response regulator YesN
VLPTSRSGKSVLRSWLVSYAILALMPVVVSAVVYVQTLDVVQGEINRANSEVLKQVVMAIDNRLQDVRSLAVSVAFNQTLNILIHDESQDAIRRHYYLVRQTLGDLRTYNLTNWYVDEINVYLARSDSMLTPNGVETIDFFYRDERQKGIVFREFLSYEAWRQLLEGDYPGGYLVLGGGGGVASAAQAVVYVRSLPVFGDSRRSATLIVSLNSRRFYETIQSVATVNEGWGVVLDARGNVLYSTKPLKAAVPVAYGAMAGRSGFVRGKIGGESYTISYISSDVEDWKYLSMMPTRIYDEKVARTRNLIIAGTLASLILGAVLALYLSRRNYGPVNALVQDLSSRTGRQAAKGRNEFMFIQDAVDDTLVENAKITEILRRQNDALRAGFLSGLLKGRAGDEVFVANALESFDVRFESDRFAVILYYIRDLGEASGARDVGPARRHLAEAAEEVACRSHRGYVAEVDNMLACIVSFAGSEGTEDVRAAIEVANSVADLAHDRHGILVTASVSEVHESPAGIATAYREALDVLEYQRALDIEETLRYAQIRESGGAYDYPMETEQQLINSIKAGDLATATSIVSDVFARNLGRGALSSDMVRCLTFDLASTMLKTISELGALGDEELLQRVDVAKRLLGCERIHDMQGEMTKILSEICAAVHARRKPRRDLLVDQVRQFIEASYQDPELSVVSVARRFRLTPTYLIKLFRDQTGEGVYHRITHLRMDKAKKLLREDGSSIKEVAASVGYYSSAAFIRAFKRAEGVTPGSFKEMDAPAGAPSP